MTKLIWGMVLFFGVHLMSLTPLRAAITSKLSENAYKGIYSLISLAGLGLMIWGFILARAGPDAARIVYDPIVGSSLGTTVLVLAALVLLASAHGKSHIRLWVKHPMSLGVALWATGHLLVNGNLSEVLLFGGFLTLGVLDIIVNTARGKVPSYEPKLKHDIIAVVAGVVIFGVVFSLHQTLFSVSPVY
ncbi:NnrU family protein [Anderseniella sp. Alg231-50]|uniref:NnrU family protein n=1 Tax=Anderseniella sp. Alg231-50 TaxID=1922226 RepID=UPI00307B5186